MSKEIVTVEVGKVTARIARSPFYWAIVALTGVSITLAPLAVYNAGKAGKDISDPSVLVYVCIIYLVPLFYMRLGSPVADKLRSMKKEGA